MTAFCVGVGALVGGGKYFVSLVSDAFEKLHVSILKRKYESITMEDQTGRKLKNFIPEFPSLKFNGALWENGLKENKSLKIEVERQSKFKRCLGLINLLSNRVRKSNSRWTLNSRLGGDLC